jgi:DNA-binding winged helix-turn-helix (wHTH) protein/TolB-like protein
VAEESLQIYEFGEFRLETGRRLLLRRDDRAPVKLTSKALDLLLALVQRQGETLSKEELMGAVWPDAVVEENNLNQKISELRRALGERQGENRYIATVPRRGFRFVADVEAREADENGSTPQETIVPADREAGDAGSPPSKRNRLRTAWIVVAAFVVATVVTGAVLLARRGASKASAAQIRVIAVLPFKPLLSEERNEALELGMADSLIVRLARVRNIEVRPLTAVRRFGGSEQDPLEAGRELGVDGVLDGSVHRSGERVRVTARFFDIRNGSELWAGQFDESFTDIFSVQDRISERVAQELALRLTPQDRDSLARRETNDPEAYELYLRGRFFMSGAEPQKAIVLFEEAIRRDPAYARAHAGLADIYSRLPIAADIASREPSERARRAAGRALEIDGSLPEAHTALGWVAFYYEWDWKRSEAGFRRALELAPDDFSARLGYAHLLSNTGRHEEALRQVDRARALDPLSPLAHSLKAQFLFSARRYEEAQEQLKSTLSGNPTFWIAQVLSGREQARVGEFAEAIRLFRRARESGGSTMALAFAGHAHALAGETAEAEAVLSEMVRLSESEYVPPYNLALIHLGLGRHAEAIQFLERGADERDARMVFLGIDPAWDALRSDPRFMVLLERLDLSSAHPSSPG